MSVHEIRHPLVRHKIDLLREAETGPKLFRELSAELATLLTYEALRDLTTERKTIQGWAGAVEADHLRVDLLTVVPVVRAGLGLLPGVLQILPHIEVSLVGLYRNEETLEPVPYFEKLVDRMFERTALIIDPMLGTGGTCSATVDILKKAGCRSIRAICLVAVPEGLTAWRQPTRTLTCIRQPLMTASTTLAISFPVSVTRVIGFSGRRMAAKVGPGVTTRERKHT